MIESTSAFSTTDAPPTLPPPTDPCPPPDVLARLHAGSVSDETFQHVDSHIDKCGRCQSDLQRRLDTPFSLDAAQYGPAKVPGSRNELTIPGFEIENEIGRGGGSVVYRAMDIKLKRRVALKVVRSGPLAESRDRTRWLYEAKAASHVRHPNIVNLYDAGEADGWLYLVFEYISGGDLTRRLAKPLAPRDAGLLLETIARAVSAMHRANLLHLDLKPSNVLIDASDTDASPFEKARVTDFGLAAVRNDPDLSMPTIDGPRGTPPYMSPEQAAGDASKIGYRTDVYGLGAILYRVLTGQPPFASSSDFETLRHVRESEPIPPRRCQRGIPRDLETICLTCLQKNPAERYPTAEALADDVRRWLDGRPIHARPVSSMERTWRFCRRQPMVASLFATLLLTTTASAMALAILWRQSESARGAAVAARQIAESEQHTAEINLGAACSAIEYLEYVAMNASDHPDVLRGGSLKQTVSLVERQIEPLKNARGFDFRLLGMLANLKGRVRVDLLGLDQIHDARAVAWEAMDLFRECHERDPASREYVQGYAVSLVEIARIELLSQHFDEAFARIAQAQDVISRDARPELWLYEIVDEISGLYVALRSLFIQLGRQERAMATLDRTRDLLRLWNAAPPKSADVTLWRACVLGDLEEWDQAFAAARSITQPSSLEHAKIPFHKKLFEQAAASWYRRLIKRTERVRETPEASGSAFAEVAEKAFSSLTDTYLAVGLKWTPSFSQCDLIALAYTERAVNQRRLGMYREAENTARHFTAFALRMVNDQPQAAGSYLLLSEAHLQHGKNASKRDDFLMVKQSVERSLSAVDRALVIEPNNPRLLMRIKDRKERIARVDKLLQIPSGKNP